MAQYLIHSCEDRLWYVENFLIPSMVKQGISKGDIDVYTDTDKLGNLEAFIQSILLMDTGAGTWHLQDDIVICKQFKRWTEEYDDGVVCGFWSKYSKEMPAGMVGVKQMWYSFPCIRIPDVIAKEFATWFYRECVYNPEYRLWIQKKKYDDTLFRIFLEDFYPDMSVLNLAPNIVDHIDYLIGGSLINPLHNEEHVKSISWEDNDVTQELRKELMHYEIRDNVRRNLPVV